MNIAMSMDIFQQPEDTESRPKLALSLIWIQSSDSAIIRLLRLSLRIMTAKTLHLEPAQSSLPENVPHLSTLKGRTLITSDGTTILGADDKAGIARL